jgi:hypothetical protein
MSQNIKLHVDSERKMAVEDVISLLKLLRNDLEVEVVTKSNRPVKRLPPAFASCSAAEDNLVEGWNKRFEQSNYRSAALSYQAFPKLVQGLRCIPYQTTIFQADFETIIDSIVDF